MRTAKVYDALTRLLTALQLYQQHLH
eukprot:COSAG02_NODE_14321_length_1284_cov_2.267511_1_plen_25_part_10